MFSRLPESNATRQRRTGGLVVSTVVHLAIIALAVQATGLTAAPAPAKLPQTRIYLAPVEPNRPPEPAPVRRLLRDPSVPPVAPTVALPPVIGPGIPDGIPDPGMMNALFDPTFDSTAIGTRAPSDGPNVAGRTLFRGDQVEQPVLAIPGTATPRYPSMLQSAGIEGDVRMQFVVDTLGRVEHASVQVVETSNDLFSVAVREALARARFAPAQVGGRKVRQLVEQTFTFRISR